MWLCDYINDLGIKYKRIKPFITGINRITGEAIPTAEVLLTVSRYLDIDGYYEVGNREAVCTMLGRRRRIRLEFKNSTYELDYYKPFTDIDWQLLEEEKVACETIPEFINDGNLKLIMLKL